MSKKGTKEFNIKDFSLKVLDRQIDPESWKEFYEYKKKEKKDDNDKFYMQEFRKDLKNDEVEVMITHKTSKISHSFVVPKVDRKDLIKQFLKFVQDKRQALKQEATAVRDFDGAKIETIGGVRVKPNLTNTYAKYLNINDPYKAKSPRIPTKNYIGVELEFNESLDCSRADLAELFKEQGLARYVSCKADTSCGHEVAVILPQDDFEEKLRKIIKIINDCKFKADARCGTHVHIDMRNRDVNTVYNNYFMLQNFFRKFLTKERQDNRNCVKNIYSSFIEQYEDQKSSKNKYFGINTLSYDRYKTLEIRMHQGTLNADHLIIWIKTLVAVADYKEKIEMETPELDGVVKIINLDHKNDIESRFEKLHKPVKIPDLSKEFYMARQMGGFTAPLGQGQAAANQAAQQQGIFGGVNPGTLFGIQTITTPRRRG